MSESKLLEKKLRVINNSALGEGECANQNLLISKNPQPFLNVLPFYLPICTSDNNTYVSHYQGLTKSVVVHSHPILFYNKLPEFLPYRMNDVNRNLYYRGENK